MKTIKNIVSECCNAPVIRVGLVIFCLKCNKPCKMKDEVKNDRRNL
jgi:hypothetical protein